MNCEFKELWTANCWMICWVAQLFGSLNIILFGSVNSTWTICDMFRHKKKRRSTKIVWKCVSTLKSFSILCCSLIVRSILFHLFFFYLFEVVDPPGQPICAIDENHCGAVKSILQRNYNFTLLICIFIIVLLYFLEVFHMQTYREIEHKFLLFQLFVAIYIDAI